MSNKKSNIGSFLWSGIERFGSVFLTFVFNWILARFFLSPKDFGLIGMLYVFIALANTTVIGGFGQALIQKKKPTKSDYDTVFVWNIVLATLLYGALFILAPYIASFYNQELLSPLLRVLSLTLIINSFIVVQNNLLVKQMDFKKLSAINLSSSLLGYLIGLFFALRGAGVWCLVANTLSIQLFQAVFLWSTSVWKPSLKFRLSSFKELFSFGGFMYLSTLFETLYNNFSYFIIGKMFSPTLLGYYTQAEKLQTVPTTTISSIVNQVAFPLFSSFQDAPIQLAIAVRKNIRIIAYLNAALMILLACIAKPIILIIFTDKWEESIWIFQILCISGILYPLNSANTTLLKSIGKGKLLLTLQIVKRLLGVVLLIAGSLLGLDYMLYALCLSSLIFFIINALATAQYIPYSFIRQVRDVLSAIILPCLSVGIVSIVLLLLNLDNLLISLAFSVITYLLTLSIFSYITKYKPFIYLMNLCFK